MQQYTPETEAVFRPRPQAEDEKMPRLRGYIVAYTTRKHRIYNIYPIQRDFFGSQNMLKNPDFPFLDLKINLNFSCNLHISPRSEIYVYISPTSGIYVTYIPEVGDICYSIPPKSGLCVFQQRYILLVFWSKNHVLDISR